MTLRRVGVVGIGAMGWPMAERLHEAGWAVTVHDIDPVRVALARAAGVAVAPDPQALAAACDDVIVAVVDAAQTREVLFGRDAGGPGDAGAAMVHRGIAGGLAAGGVVLLCPTIAPEDVVDCAARLARAGLAAIDAPMSGGPQRARDGTMSLMLAGEPAVLARAQPLLAALSDRRFEVGRRPGDGAKTKLVNNLLAAVNLAGAAEALALAGRLGLDAASTLAVVEQSSGQSWIASDRLRRHLAGDSTVRARVALLAKDSALALAAARAAGQAMPLGEQAAAAFARAVDAGFADVDDAALFDLAAGRAPR
ncbi:MAG: NAD(P)-dependent oxidoreductase [Rubrivivax sp.]|nr:NAD(P)-dependent oxidoreductase [Rubrivivax sp.]